MPISRKLVVGGVLVAATALVGCSTASTEPETPTSLRIAVPGGQFVTNFDPLNGSKLWELPAQAVYEPLLQWDLEANAWGPWLAKEFQISEDGLTMSVTLRDDVDFSDGSHMDAEGVVTSLTATLASEKAYFHYLESMYEPRAEATGEYTFEITTTKQMYEGSQFLLELSRLPIASAAAVRDPSSLADAAVGSGPYLVDEVVPEVSVSFVRNPDYWDPDAVDFDEIVITRIDDKVAAFNALRSGQIDAAELDGSFADEADAEGLTVNTGSSATIAITIADRLGESIPALGDVRVRQALNFAIDREAIVEALEFGYANPTSQPFDATRAESVDGGDDRYAYDLERARELMAEAGYEDGFTIRLVYDAGRSRVDYKPTISQFLSAINVTVEWIQMDPEANWVDQVRELEVHGVLFDYWFHNMIQWLGSSGNPFFAEQTITDPEFTDLMAKYEFGSIPEHDAAIKPLAAYILEQAWYVQISQPEGIIVTSPGIETTVANRPSPYPVLSRFQLAE